MWFSDGLEDLFESWHTYVAIWIQNSSETLTHVNSCVTFIKSGGLET